LPGGYRRGKQQVPRELQPLAVHSAAPDSSSLCENACAVSADALVLEVAVLVREEYVHGSVDSSQIEESEVETTYPSLLAMFVRTKHNGAWTGLPFSGKTGTATA